MPNSSVYSKTITIPYTAIDENGHVNNVTYVQWMQDIAVEHYSSIGGVEIQGQDATWVVREHKIEYLFPAFAGEELEIRTWVENIRRVRSLRKYEFVRKSDRKMLARETVLSAIKKLIVPISKNNDIDKMSAVAGCKRTFAEWTQ